jgi:hypothetical protein
MNSFKTKIKAIFLLLSSNRFLLITTHILGKDINKEEDVRIITGNMQLEDVVCFSDAVYQDALEMIEIRDEVVKANSVADQMSAMILNTNLN